jgi:hypothetical protein
MNPLYFLVAERAGHRCEYCHAPESIFNAVFEVEHINPVAAGGDDREDNLALACRSCNSFKGNRSSHLDPQLGREERFYHPRTDRWEDHFLAIPESSKISALTAIGRVTVIGLRFNSPPQVTARQFWIQLGLFP